MTKLCAQLLLSECWCLRKTFTERHPRVLPGMRSRKHYHGILLVVCIYRLKFCKCQAINLSKSITCLQEQSMNRARVNSRREDYWRGLALPDILRYYKTLVIKLFVCWNRWTINEREKGTEIDPNIYEI